MILTVCARYTQPVSEDSLLVPVELARNCGRQLIKGTGISGSCVEDHEGAGDAGEDLDLVVVMVKYLISVFFFMFLLIEI